MENVVLKVEKLIVIIHNTFSTSFLIRIDNISKLTTSYLIIRNYQITN